MCLHLIWPDSQTSRCRCGVARVLRFQDGKGRRDHVDVGISEVVVGICLEVTVKEQQGRVNHEKGEGEMERSKTHMCKHLFMHLSHESVRSLHRVCVHQKNVRATG